MHLRYLAVLLCSALFSLGSAKMLVEGLASGQYRGAKSARIFFSTSPIQFSLITVFFMVVCVLFGYLAWATFRDGPVRVEADLDALKAERIAQRTRVRKKAPPSTAGMLHKIAGAAAAIGLGVPFKVGLSALLGKPLADAVFGLWLLIFVSGIGTNGRRWAQRGDEAWPTGASGMNKAARRVLVVDDMASIRSVVMALLKSAGYDAVGAGNGQAALDLLSKKPFDLVLSDWNMPEMNGSEFVQRIRATNKALPIIMVTAERDPGRVMELRDLGVNGYLIKPFKPAALMAVLDKLFPPGSKNAA